MPSPPNISNIPAPRVPLVDKQGFVSREWFRWFINIFTLTGSGQSDVSLTDLQLGPSLETVVTEDGAHALQEIGGLPPPTDLASAYAAIQGLSVEPTPSSGSVTQVDTGTGLTGGPITTTGTVTLANTAVTPGAYTSANFTVDQQGRLTAAANGAAGTVTSITAGAGLTGGVITTAGTVAIDFTSANTWTARQTFTRPNTPGVAFASLPATPTAGDRAMVTDASATTFASVAAGSGANIVPVYYDGTDWRIG